MKKIFLSILLSFCCIYFAKAQIPTGVTAYWPFHGNAADSSGNNNNGVVHGATLTEDRFGNCNQAYKFDGVNDYILVQNSPTINMVNTDFTIAFWIKTAKNDTNGFPLCKNQYGNWSGYFFATNSNNGGYCTGYRHAFFYVAAGFQQDACSNNGIDTSWHFFTGVYKHISNQGYFYLDGVQQADIGQASGPTNNTQNLAFGAHNIGTTLFFTGVLDAIRIYNRALNNAEILQLYNEADPGSLDTTLAIDTAFCSSGTITLSAPISSTYSWSTGSTVQTTTLTNTGTYWVQLHNQTGCKQTDTFHVTMVNPPAYNILHDTSVCANAGYVLNASSSGATNYHWSTGAINSSIMPTVSGVYWVDMHISQCIVRDSVTVTLLSSPTVNLPGNIINCSSPLVLAINDPTLTYTWSTGSSAGQISVTTSGIYWVQIQTSNGCKRTDTVHAIIVDPIAYDILKDTISCINIGYTLNASAGNVNSYNWSTGATGPIITPTVSGMYWVDMLINQCVVRDSAQVTLNPMPIITLVKDTTICAEAIVLTISDTSLFVTWWNGSHSNQASVNSPGTYSVSATKNGCTTFDTVIVRKLELSGTFVIPNVVTPNGDGINDFFEFNTAGFTIKEFNL